jgi:predicted MFS family arabinose efflux permease
VPTDRLDAANGRLSAATDVMDELIGPPLGVALFALAAAAPFIVDAGSFAISALLLATIAGSFRAARAPQHTSLREEIGEGLRFVRSSRVLLILAAGIGALAFFNVANLAVLVLYVTRTLGLPSAGYGYLLMTIAIGGVLASLTVERITQRWDNVHVLAVAVAVNGGGYLLLAIAHGPALATVGTFAWGAGVSTGMIISIGLRQALTPDHLLGRVMSVFRVLVGLGGVIGALLGGVVADAAGLRMPYLVSGVVQLALAPVFGITLVRARRAAAVADGPTG